MSLGLWKLLHAITATFLQQLLPQERSVDIFETSLLAEISHIPTKWEERETSAHFPLIIWSSCRLETWMYQSGLKLIVKFCSHWFTSYLFMWSMNSKYSGQVKRPLIQWFRSWVPCKFELSMIDELKNNCDFKAPACKFEIDCLPVLLTLLPAHEQGVCKWQLMLK